MAGPPPASPPRLREQQETRTRPQRSLSFIPATEFSSRERSSRQVDPHGRMVGGLVPGSHLLVDRDRLQLVGGLRRQEQMVDADAVVLLPGGSLIIPKAVEARSVGGGAQGVDQAERYKLTELEAGRWQKQSVADPILGPRGV